MKALAISGSPRKDGNTDTILKYILEEISKSGIDTEFISLYNKKVAPCIACGQCKKKKDGSCSIKDDFSDIFNKMVSSEIIVVGSPVYFGSATSQLTSLLDRAGYTGRAAGMVFSRKIGGPFVVARRAGHNFTFAQLLYWYMINDMIVPGSSYWNIAFGGSEGEVEDDVEGMKTAKRFAENLVFLAKRVF